jgi:antitoxin ParD1/3/4
MSTLNISLPEVMKAFVEEQVRSGMYGSASDYVRALIREDQKRKAEERLEALLLEGLSSGEARPMTAKDWAEIHQTVRKKMAQRKTA